MQFYNSPPEIEKNKLMDSKRKTYTERKIYDDIVMKEIQKSRKTKENQEKIIDAIINNQAKKSKINSVNNKFPSPAKFSSSIMMRNAPVKSFIIDNLLTTEEILIVNNSDKEAKNNVIRNYNEESLGRKELGKNSAEIIKKIDFNNDKIKASAENNESLEHIEQGLVNSTIYNDDTISKHYEEDIIIKANESKDLKPRNQPINDLETFLHQRSALETFIIETNLPSDAIEKLKSILKLK